MHQIQILEAENRKLQNKIESKDAYIKALQDQCKLSHDLIESQKKKIMDLSIDLLNTTPVLNSLVR